MPNNQASTRFKLTLVAPRGEEFDDVIWCAFVRAPVHKRMSYCLLHINVSGVVAYEIFNELNDGSKIPFMLRLEEIADQGQDGVKETRIIRTLFDCPYICLNTFDERPYDFTEQNADIKLILINQIFYDLEIKSVYNKRFQKKTAFQVLLDYENFLKNHYGDAFYIHREIPENMRSTHEYEELLISAKNDIAVPETLTLNFKATKNYCYYFFDDFCFTNYADKPFVCHHIDLNAYKEFANKLRIEEYSDILFTTSMLRIKTFKDTFESIVQGADKIIFKSPKGFTYAPVDTGFGDLYRPQISSSADGDRISVVGNREIITHGRYSMSFTSSTEVRKKIMNILVPDNKEAAIERFNNFRLLIENRIKHFVEYQTKECYIDWPQFGHGYNLNQTRPEEFLLTPVMITNIFYKDTNSRSVKHMVRFIMAEFYTEERTLSNICSSCDFYSLTSSMCSIHRKPRLPESSCYNYKLVGSGT